jgi:4-amino-4-deoxy-L-arabinose transferase-like glycosyltransferase
MSFSAVELRPVLAKDNPAVMVLGLIAATAMLRIILAGWFGLGIDESYMVAAGRHLQLSYFDHPPLSWWLAWGGAHLFGSESPLAVRSPFIALFALSSWLLYRLTSLLFSPRAGFFAVLLANLAPVLGFTTASWVLPDGPLDCALLGFSLCLARALQARASGWWLAAGVWAGLALLSKYSAVLNLAGAGLFLLTQPMQRRWLARPAPWLAAMIGLAIFSPVVVWNFRHGWASFAFQGSRATGLRLHPFAPLTTLAGEALFLLPWLWLPLMMVFFAALRRGPVRPESWLLCCLGAPPVLVFALISLWSHERVLFHWAAPGYLLLLPLLGAEIASRMDAGSRVVRRVLVGSAVFVIVALGLVGSDIRWNWLGPAFARDPAIEAVDWTSLRTELSARRLLAPGGPVVAATRWLDAGKLDYALGGGVAVICLGDDPREYGLLYPPGFAAGRDLLIVAPGMTLARAEAAFGGHFADLEALEKLTLLHAGRPILDVPVYRGRHYRP